MSSAPDPTPFRSAPRAVAIVAVLGCLALGGCGSQQYEERLEESRKMFAYFYQLDQKLQRPTAPSKLGGVTVRIPKGFEPIPEPPRGDEETPEGEEPPPDPRQPDYFVGGVRLTGLEGAWRADVKLSGDRTLPGYIYVLSNFNLWNVEGQTETAAGFLDVVTQELLHGFNIPQSPDQLPTATIELPEGTSYVAGTNFRVFNLTPRIEEVPYKVTAYTLLAGDNRAAIVHVRPADTPSAIEEQLKLSMETVKLTADKPKGARGTAAESSEF